jgi:hypothetical protein
VKKHLQVDRQGRAEPLCGRQISRPGPGSQVAPGGSGLVTLWAEVTCGWCLAKMASQGLSLTEPQWRMVAKKSVPGARDGETQEDEEGFEEVEEEAS